MVGTLEDHFTVQLTRREQGHPEAGRTEMLDLMARLTVLFEDQHIALREVAEYPLCNLCRQDRCVLKVLSDVNKQDNELISTQASDGVLLANAVFQTPCDRLQQHVTG